VNFIKKVKITADATPTAGVFTVSLEEKYYNKRDFRFREWNSIVYCSASDLQRNQNFEHKVKMVSNGGIGCFYVKERTYYTFPL
jgi:hypothetical protein